jgi:hypothetical protein
MSFAKLGIIPLLFFGLVGISTKGSAWWVPPGEVEQAIEQLQRIVWLTRYLSARDVEQLDQARLLVIRKSAETVLKSIHENGLGNFETMGDYQKLIITFRFSVSYFKTIPSDETKYEVASLAQLGRDIEKARGFKKNPYGKTVEMIFDQQHNLFLQLSLAASIPSNLQRDMNKLIAPLANVIAIARAGGDRPNTFDAAHPVYHAIVDLYPQLQKVEQSNSAYNVILEILGLNELYTEFGQEPRGETKSQPTEEPGHDEAR